MNSWLFPPKTREVQFDEKWSFVAKKEKHCRPGHADDVGKGDCWDHVALDPEHRLVVSLVVGRRTAEHTRLLVEDFRDRTEGRLMNLMTSDELPAYAEAIREVYGEEVRPARSGRPGRPPGPYRQVPEGLTYATVHKVRENNRVVKVEARLVFGTLANLVAALVWTVLGCVSTVFIERSNGTDRGRNSRKVRKTYRFSKDWEVHRAMTVFTLYSANFCWCVRTLREEIIPKKCYRRRTAAMVAGLTDHVWTLKEWLLFTSTKRYKLSPFRSR
jgi:IS1 family transposase